MPEIIQRLVADKSRCKRDSYVLFRGFLRATAFSSMLLTTIAYYPTTPP